MLLGEYDHTLDDKNRLTLPAKFRERLADGVVLTRGLDTVSRPTRAGLAAARRASASPGSTRSATRRADWSASTTRAPWRREPDKQGRVMLPPRLLEHAGLGREVVVAGIRDRLEIWDRAAWRTQLKEVDGRCRACCRTSCSPTRLITSPFWPTRCATLLALEPGRRWSTAPSARAAMPSLLARDLHGNGKVIAIDRDPTVRPYFERFRRDAG